MDANSARRRRARILWAAVAGALCALAAGLVPLRSAQLWWHLAIGQLIDTYQAVPTANHLVYAVAPEAPSLLPEWLAQWALWELWELGDIEAVLTTRNLLGGLAVALAALASRPGRGPAWAIAPAACLGGLAAAAGAHAGPILLAAPLFALNLWAIDRTQASPRPRWRRAGWIIAPLMAALWANLDYGWGMPALLALWAAARAWRPVHGELSAPPPRAEALGWLASAAAALAAGALNPRGATLFGHALEVLSTYPQAAVTPAWHPLMEAGPALALLGVSLAVAVGLATAAARVRPSWRPRGPDWLLVVALAAAAILVTRRAALWYGLALPLVVAPALGALWRGRPDRSPASVWAWGALLVGALALPAPTQPLLVTHADLAVAASRIAPWQVRQRQPHRGVIPAQVPVESGALLAQLSAPPRVWVNPDYRPYVLFMLAQGRPLPVVFSDRRVELLPEDIARVAELVHEQPDLWRGIFQQYDVSAALLSRRADAALLEQLREHPGWQIAHQDDHSVYLVRVERTPAR